MRRKEMLKLAAVAAAGLLASSTWAGTLTLIGYYGGEVYQPGGGPVPAANNWVIGLYSSGNMLPDSYGSADDTLLATTAGFSNLGVTFSAGNPWNGSVPGLFQAQANNVPDALNLFARVWNSSSTATATLYANIGWWAGVSGQFNFGVWNEVFPQSGIDAVTLPGTNPTGLDWTPVPEPASLALFGLGLVTLAARKLRRK